MTSISIAADYAASYDLSSVGITEKLFVGSKNKHVYSISSNNPFEYFSLLLSKYQNNALIQKLKQELEKDENISAYNYELMFSFGEETIYKLLNLAFQSASISVISSDIVAFKVIYKENLEILIVKSFEEGSDDTLDPVVTLLQKNEIIFQDRLPIEILVSSIQESEV